MILMEKKSVEILHQWISPHYLHRIWWTFFVPPILSVVNARFLKEQGPNCHHVSCKVLFGWCALWLVGHQNGPWMMQWCHIQGSKLIQNWNRIRAIHETWNPLEPRRFRISVRSCWAGLVKSGGGRSSWPSSMVWNFGACGTVVAKSNYPIFLDGVTSRHLRISEVPAKTFGFITAQMVSN